MKIQTILFCDRCRHPHVSPFHCFVIAAHMSLAVNCHFGQLYKNCIAFRFSIWRTPIRQLLSRFTCNQVKRKKNKSTKANFRCDFVLSNRITTTNTKVQLECCLCSINKFRAFPVGKSKSPTTEQCQLNENCVKSAGALKFRVPFAPV